MDSTDRLLAFQRFLLHWHELYGRHTLPWRQTTDPYAILVSELMLQQTQAARVIPKFQAFLKQFPNLTALKKTDLATVLKSWQGLGYNRRAKFLWQLAQQVEVLPESQGELEKLPGIGPYTAAAICAFAFNQPVVLIETNVRTVFLHHFFPEQTKVADSEILALVSTALPKAQARVWYSALMDYGAYLKSVMSNPSRKSKHHVKQKRFKGSIREVRGEIIRLLTEVGNMPERLLKQQLTTNPSLHAIAIDQLKHEGLISVKANEIQLG
jgi:A/G-specific adenine glycosylase